jgi:hypothetical protein
MKEEFGGFVSDEDFGRGGEGGGVCSIWGQCWMLVRGAFRGAPGSPSPLLPYSLRLRTSKTQRGFPLMYKAAAA